MTHLESGLHVCQGWTEETEKEVPAWIANLIELLAWTGPRPCPVALMTKILRYAIMRALFER